MCKRKNNVVVLYKQPNDSDVFLRLCSSPQQRMRRAQRIQQERRKRFVQTAERCVLGALTVMLATSIVMLMIL